MKGIVFLMFFLVCSLFVYRNAAGFCIFIWYLATLLNMFMSSKSFFVGVFFSIITYHLQMVIISLLLYFLPFYFFLLGLGFLLSLDVRWGVGGIGAISVNDSRRR
jgi:hypothetical protein